jgi:CRISPR-associated protein Csm3
MDNPVIRNPLTREPYIPGSSLKGKMRSLLEWKLGKVQNNRGNPCNCGKADCQVCRVFGSANNSEGDQKGPTRLIVRDAFLSEGDKKKMKDGKAIIEEKYENSLNRITARANPRPVERVVPGVTFDFEMVYRIIDMNDGGKTDEENFGTVVLDALKLLKNDYLGGGGTRGNGRIDFTGLKDESGKEIAL